MPGKSNAPKSGERLERFIAQPLLDAGFVLLDCAGREILHESGVCAAVSSNLGQPFFATHIVIPGVITVYRKPWRLDVFLWHGRHMKKGMVLECKWQAGSGSCDEKLPFTIQSLAAILNSKEVDRVGLMLEASGMRECARVYAREQCPKLRVELFEGPSAWAAWVNKNLSGRTR
jgi:hypothetical protein